MVFHVLATARSFCKTDGPHHEFLRENGCEVTLHPPVSPLSAPDLRRLIPGYEGLILGLDYCDATVLAASDRLRAISRYGSGVDRVDVEAATRQRIVITTTPGVNRVAVAELAVGLMFSLARSIPQVVINTRSGVWERVQGWELYDKTLGIIGFGAIGREVATRAAALGMHVLAYDPFSTVDLPGVQPADLPGLLSEAHIVSLHCAVTPETEGLINAKRIAQMRDGAYLVNTARGELVDEDALYAALQSGKLAGAASDVFRREPPEGNPLLTCDNFLATLHMGGTSRESTLRMAMMAAQNLVDALHRRPNAYVVNPAAIDFR
jgi:phosphoglycerate dehydrogenase-like enzyme